MTSQDFQRAFDLAKSSEDLSGHDINIFNGFGLPSFKPIVATVQSVARCIRWQAQYLSGGWDNEALTECRNCFRHRVTMVG